MAQYKVPQDVEADDKLIGPFSFRQFVYLLIAGGGIAVTVLLFQIFPALAILPLPIILLFLALALPLKKDQPMETYLTALVSYYLKPHVRKWVPGQRESTVHITAPKIVEDVRTRDISGEEATHRLSFLANLMDTEGYSIKGANNNVRDEFVAEANATTDMYDNYKMMGLGKVVNDERKERHEEAVQEMREAIMRQNELNQAAMPQDNIWRTVNSNVISALPGSNNQVGPSEENTVEENNGFDRVVVMPEPEFDEKKDEKNAPITPKPSIIELANNTDFTVATIAKEANRINRKDEDEVFVSLH